MNEGIEATGFNKLDAYEEKGTNGVTSVDVLMDFIKHSEPTFKKHPLISSEIDFCKAETTICGSECPTHSICMQYSKAYTPTITHEEFEAFKLIHPEMCL
jgi:hypothetical protein